MQSKARKLGIASSLRDLNEARTVAALAARISGRGPAPATAAEEEPPAHGRQDGATWPMSSLQRMMIAASMHRADPHAYHNATVTRVDMPFEAPDSLRR